MSKTIEIHGENNIPEEGALVIPGRLDFNQMLLLEQIFAGRSITWLCEENIVLDDSVRSYLEQDGITAVAFSARR